MQRRTKVNHRRFSLALRRNITHSGETYFDLNVSYRDYLDRIDPEDAYLIRAAAFGSGIRILRQDVWEMIITFILSQQNNIPRIRKMIRELSHSFGEKKEAEDGTFYYGFPTPERLAGVSEDELREMKFGYRSRYICGSAASVADGRFDLASLTGMEYGRAKEELINHCRGSAGRWRTVSVCSPFTIWMRFRWIRISKACWIPVIQLDFRLRDIGAAQG